MRFRSDRKSTRLNSSHLVISYAVFCLKKKRTEAAKGEALSALRGVRLRSLRASVWTCCARVHRAEYAHFNSFSSVDLFFFFFYTPRPPHSSPLPPPAPLSG